MAGIQKSKKEKRKRKKINSQMDCEEGKVNLEGAMIFSCWSFWMVVCSFGRNSCEERGLADGISKRKIKNQNKKIK